MTAAETFGAHLRRASTGVLERLPRRVRSEVYVLALDVWRVDADDRYPYVGIGHNTESRYREAAEAEPDEARWNYAHWILEGFDRLGNVPGDPVGAPLWEAEAARLGLWYDGPFDLGRRLDDPGTALKADLLRSRFQESVIGLARDLNASGTVERIFGRPLPVVVFDMDSPGWEEQATAAANPPGLIAGFLAYYA
ncbi:hypothetical protein ACFCX4_06090 [Kitasatospora sp. NPDC056327]|uniref:hypothetical protein n=1 Tax=Kitasatospora sp. NPDC056327 TaxID=3345785 RepID=UPI0035D8CFF2